ncbi:MAG: hypothetical protein ABIJ37_00435 [Pseudomonadota bacterium]
MDNLRLGAKARIAIANDERTHEASVKVRADNGLVTVTYLPQDSGLADFIPAVCKNLPGLKEIRTTMAMTNLLWIEEEFHPGSEVWDQVLEIATKWNAAVELMRLAPEDEKTVEEGQTIVSSGRETSTPGSREYDGGIEDDVLSEATDNGGFKQTSDELARIGKSGGGRVIYGGQQQLINAIDRTTPYTLVVIGEVFKSKDHSAKLRATRDLSSFLSDRIKAPVVTSDELGSQYLFGKRDIPKTLAFLIVALAIYLLVFTNQEFVLAFLAGAGWYAETVKNTFLSKVSWAPRIIVSLAVFILVPIVAYSYGTLTKAIMKLIKME